MSKKSNPTAPATPIELGGKTRHLLLDFNALALIEEKTGKNALDGDTWKTISASMMRIILWACLQHEGAPYVTLEEAGAMITPRNASAVAQAIQKTMAEAMPESDGNESGDPNASPPNG